jgi:hypothetical protein
VTVFTNGVWYSTNGWAGTAQQLDYLVSEFYPDQTPEQLYAQHKQGVQKLTNRQRLADSETPAKTATWRTLSDHLRWYLKFKNISRRTRRTYRFLALSSRFSFRRAYFPLNRPLFQP